jgi:hypothetical protein
LHDAVQIEQQGTPATVLITEPFQGLAAAFSGTLGMAGYHHVMVPHPVATKDEVQLRALAVGAADSVADQLMKVRVSAS